MKVTVYKAEREAGLAEAVRKNRFGLASVAELSDKFEVSSRAKAQVVGGKVVSAREKSFSDQVVATNLGQMDLHYLKTVLVSTGWNLNDHVFLPKEVWAARATPEDKPFNYEHDCSDIIGHITASCVLDDEKNVLPEDTAEDELPEKFHILTGAVLYRYWEKAELQERMDRLIAEISEGKWFVSMECLFSSFDYLLTDEQGGNQKVVARSGQTAYLTKHLKFYGGTGSYQNQRVGMLLRNICFSGKGLVKKPANPESVILANLSAPVADAGYSTLKETSNVSEKIDFEKLASDLKAENELLAKSQKELVSAREKAETELTSVKTAAEEAARQLKVLTEERDTAIAKAAEVTRQLSTAEASLKSTAEELGALKAAKVKSDRVAAVKKTLGLEDEVKAEAMTAPLLSLTDASFDEWVKAWITNNPQSGNTTFPKPSIETPPKQTPAPLPPKSTNLASGSANADPGVLDRAVANMDAALATASENTVDKVRQDIANFFKNKSAKAATE